MAKPGPKPSKAKLYNLLFYYFWILVRATKKISNGNPTGGGIKVIVLLKFTNLAIRDVSGHERACK